MLIRHLPCARGAVTINCPVAPFGRVGKYRYKRDVAVTQVLIFLDDELDLQASFFDRSAVLPWVQQHIGPIEPWRLRAKSASESLRYQEEILHDLERFGMLTESAVRTYRKRCVAHLTRELQRTESNQSTTLRAAS